MITIEEYKEEVYSLQRVITLMAKEIIIYERIIRKAKNIKEQANFGSQPRFNWYDKQGDNYELGLMLDDVVVPAEVRELAE